MTKSVYFYLLMFGLLLAPACEDDSRSTDETGERGDDGDDDDGTRTEGSEDDITEADCDSLLEITVRDFDESHPDMQRSDLGWGPLAGVVEPELGEDRRPVFSDAMGTHTWKMGQPAGELVKNCWDSGPGTEEQCYMGSIPMFDGADSFYDWYHDTEYNKRFEKTIEMEPDPSEFGEFIYDSSAFFPLSPSEGFGVSPSDNNPGNMNFLFTTEIHLLFTYQKGQRFTFRGDDDLWIFVNNKLALDLGGLHLPFEGTLDFDAKASELGIEPGGTYHMDVFHAERHTSESNFRIETNISCFIPIKVV
jgi:fibro-slime domain-containing protein